MQVSKILAPRAVSGLVPTPNRFETALIQKFRAFSGAKPVATFAENALAALSIMQPFGASGPGKIAGLFLKPLSCASFLVICRLAQACRRPRKEAHPGL